MIEINKSKFLDEMLEDYHKDKKFMDYAFKVDEQGMDIVSLDGHSYGIGGETMNTHKKILEWLQHLLSKPWFMEDPRYVIGFLSGSQKFLEPQETEKTL